jgi:Zn/Cd-binding protein ZinT
MEKARGKEIAIGYWQEEQGRSRSLAVFTGKLQSQVGEYHNKEKGSAEV